MKRFDLLFCLMATAAMAIPQLVSYQGRLTDDQGNPFEGQAQMEFSLYEAETGGVAFWQEAQTVQVKEGIFNVLLGSMVPLERFPPESWLEVKVAGEALPRQRITSVPYAYQADLFNSRYVMGDTVVEVEVAEPSVLWVGAGCDVYGGSNPSAPQIWVEVNGDTLWGSLKRFDLRGGSGSSYCVSVPVQVDAGFYTFRLRCSGSGDWKRNHTYLWVLVSGRRQ